jgi:hypothetical protein
VLQLINKADGPFNQYDEEVMGMFNAIAAPILRSSHLYQSLQGKKKKEHHSENEAHVTGMSAQCYAHQAHTPARRQGEYQEDVLAKGIAERPCGRGRSRQ